MRPSGPLLPDPNPNGGGDPMVQGVFGQAQAERLLWRAGFGPRPGDVDRFAQMGLDAAVDELVNPPAEQLNGPAPVDDDGNPLGARGPVGPRPLLVAGPDGALQPAARRADDADLPRLVRDLERHGQRLEADARPERAAAQPRARLVPRPAARHHARPGDAALAQRHRQHEVRPERELRARGHGAVHARRGPRRLHRAGRARARAGASPAGARLGRRRRLDELPLRRHAPRHRRRRPSSARPATTTGRRRATSA